MIKQTWTQILLHNKLTPEMMTPILNSYISLQGSSGGIAELLGGLIGLIIQLALIIVIVAGFWKTFEKADEPGDTVPVAELNDRNQKEAERQQMKDDDNSLSSDSVFDSVPEVTDDE